MRSPDAANGPAARRARWAGRGLGCSRLIGSMGLSPRCTEWCLWPRIAGDGVCPRLSPGSLRGDHAHDGPAHAGSQRRGLGRWGGFITDNDIEKKFLNRGRDCGLDIGVVLTANGQLHLRRLAIFAADKFVRGARIG